MKKPTKWLYPFYRYSLGKFETENDNKIDEITLEYRKEFNVIIEMDIIRHGLFILNKVVDSADKNETYEN
ncbi:MAG: hypothetical protein HPY57_15810 [Ignavibacteria bacterium]|nr:hypothetical protein [Ignavibacteria bacterium]